MPTYNLKKRKVKALAGRRRCQTLLQRCDSNLKKLTQRRLMIGKAKHHMLQRNRKNQWLKRKRLIKRDGQ